MAAPLPQGSLINVGVQPARMDPGSFAGPDLLKSVSSGIDLGSKLARIGDLRKQLAAEDAARKAEIAKAKATVLEADAMQAKLQREFEANALTQKLLAAQIASAELATEEKRKEAAFNQTQREAAAAQAANVVAGSAPAGALSNVPAPGETAAPSVAPATAAAPAPAEGVVSPFTPTHNLDEWAKPALLNEINTTRAPVVKQTLYKKLGVKSETIPFVDQKTGSSYEQDWLVGPAGEKFQALSAPRFLKPSESQMKVDAQTADDIADFNAGGKVKAQDQINKLDGAIAALRKGSTVAASGPIVGALSETGKFGSVLRGFFTSDESRAIIKDIEQVVQQSLKTILGSQFAKAEAEQLLARSFDPYLSEEKNADRVEILKGELQGILNAKVQAAEYFRAHGTLAGFKPSEAGTPPPAGQDLDSGLRPGSTEPTVRTNSPSDIKYFRGVPYKLSPDGKNYIKVG